MVPSIWQPNLSHEALEKLRWDAARQQAKDAPGFTNYQTHVIHIYGKDTPSYVTIHEIIHLHTHQDVYSMGKFVEGLADYYAEMVCQKNGIPFAVNYKDEYKPVKRLAEVVGDEALANLTFRGDIESVRKIVDSKGAGTWKKFKAAIHNEDYDDATGLLDGVVEANQARLAEEQRQEDKQHQIDEQNEARDRQERAAKEAEERKTWPPEAKHALSARILSVTVVQGKARVMVSRGGKHRVREGWTVHAKLPGDKTIDVPIIAVHTQTCDVDFPTLDTEKAIQGDLELRPKASP